MIGAKLAIRSRDRLYLAITNEELGNLSLKQKKYPEALNSYRNSLTSLWSNSNQRQIARIYLKIGQAYEGQNQFSRANHYYRDSLALTQIVKDRFSESETIFRLARLDETENDRDTALDLARQAVDITETLSADVLNTKLKTSYFSNVYDRYQLYIALLMQKHKHFPTETFGLQALQASEKSRSRSLLETLRLSEANFIRDAAPESVAKEGEVLLQLNVKTTKLSELLAGDAELNKSKLATEYMGLSQRSGGGHNPPDLPCDIVSSPNLALAGDCR